MKKYLLAGLLTAGLVSPSLAADSFFVAQNTKTHKCKIMTQEPTGKFAPLGTSYDSRKDARSAMGSMTECQAKS